MKDEAVTIIKADPGWYLLEPVEGDQCDVVDLCPEPIIAWAVVSKTDLDGDRYFNTDPVTLEGGPPDDDPIIQAPDGRISAPNVCQFESQKKAIEHLNEQRQRIKAIKARTAKA